MFPVGILREVHFPEAVVPPENNYSESLWAGLPIYNHITNRFLKLCESEAGDTVFVPEAFQLTRCPGAGYRCTQSTVTMTGEFSKVPNRG